MIIEKFFPTLVYGKDVELNNNQLAQDIVNWSNQDKGVSKTNVKVGIQQPICILNQNTHNWLLN